MHAFQFVDDLQIIFISLAKSDTRIKNDILIGDACFFCNVNGLLHIFQEICNKISVIRLFTVMHQTAWGIFSGDHACEIRIVLQSPDIVDQICSCVKCCLCHSTFVSVDRNRHIKVFLYHLDHRNHSGDLFLIGDQCITWSCGLATDINDRCSLFYHFLCMTHCPTLVVPFPAVGKRIRCHI